MIRAAALVLVAALFCSGCGDPMMATVKTENALVLTTSQLAHAVDGVDQIENGKARAKLDAGDVVGARVLYAQYKPKVEKARAAVHTGQDTLTDVEAVRSKIPTSSGGTCSPPASCTGDPKQFTAWQPAIAAALAAAEQAFAEIKSEVQ